MKANDTMNSSTFYESEDSASLPPGGMRSLAASTLSELELEELDHAALWSTARRRALEVLKSRLSLSCRCHTWMVQELDAMLPPAMRLKEVLAPREILVEFLQLQGEDGEVPDVVVKGEDPSGALGANGGPVLIRLARRYPGGIEQEASLVCAVCDYVESAADLRFLSENVHGKNVANHLLDAMDYLWRAHHSARTGLLHRGTEGEPAEGVADIRENALALCALNKLLELSEIAGLAHMLWRPRQQEFAAAIRKTLWRGSRGTFGAYRQSDGEGMERGEEGAFDPVGTAFAVRAGLLNPEEMGRSLRATLACLEDREDGEAVGWIAQVAGIYAKAGYQIPAMDMLREVAERLRDGRELGGASPEESSSFDAPPASMIAASFLNAMQKLHPMVKKARSVEEAPAPTVSFGHPSRMKFSFQKIDYDEKRENQRAPIELPVDIVVKGVRPRQKLNGVIRHPSTYGLGLQTTEAISEGCTLEIVAHCEELGGRKPCRLRGRVTWFRSKVGTRLYQSGVELDARSKDLRGWKAFILERLR